MSGICVSNKSAGESSCRSELVGLLIGGICCTVISFVNYYRVAIHEKDELTMQHPRAQILSLRLAAIIPLFNVLLVFTFVFPAGVFVLEALEALVEGFCIYCFYKMLAMYSSEKADLKRLVLDFSKDHPGNIDMATVLCCCFSSCIRSAQDRNPELFMAVVKICMFQFFTFRPIFVLIAGVFEMLAESRTNRITIAFIILHIASLLLTMSALLRFYHIVASVTTQLKPFRKLVFIKLIIIIIIIQNIIINQRFTVG